MMQRNYLTQWENKGDQVRLTFLDGSMLFVSKKDFDRAFGCIVSLSKEEVEKDFAVSSLHKVTTAQTLTQFLAYQAVMRCTNTNTPVNNVTFSVSEIQKALDDIQCANQNYLQYCADIQNGVVYELAG